MSNDIIAQEEGIQEPGIQKVEYSKHHHFEISPINTDLKEYQKPSPDVPDEGTQYTCLKNSMFKSRNGTPTQNLKKSQFKQKQSTTAPQIAILPLWNSQKDGGMLKRRKGSESQLEKSQVLEDINQNQKEIEIEIESNDICRKVCLDDFDIQLSEGKEGMFINQKYNHTNNNNNVDINVNNNQVNNNIGGKKLIQVHQQMVQKEENKQNVHKNLADFQFVNSEKFSPKVHGEQQLKQHESINHDINNNKNQLSINQANNNQNHINKEDNNGDQQYQDQQSHNSMMDFQNYFSDQKEFNSPEKKQQKQANNVSKFSQFQQNQNEMNQKIQNKYLEKKIEEIKNSVDVIRKLSDTIPQDSDDTTEQIQINKNMFQSLSEIEEEDKIAEKNSDFTHVKSKQQKFNDVFQQLEDNEIKDIETTKTIQNSIKCGSINSTKNMKRTSTFKKFPEKLFSIKSHFSEVETEFQTNPTTILHNNTNTQQNMYQQYPSGTTIGGASGLFSSISNNNNNNININNNNNCRKSQESTQIGQFLSSHMNNMPSGFNSPIFNKKRGSNASNIYNYSNAVDNIQEEDQQQINNNSNSNDDYLTKIEVKKVQSKSQQNHQNKQVSEKVLVQYKTMDNEEFKKNPHFNYFSKDVNFEGRERKNSLETFEYKSITFSSCSNAHIGSLGSAMNDSNNHQKISQQQKQQSQQQQQQQNQQQCSKHNNNKNNSKILNKKTSIQEQKQIEENDIEVDVSSVQMVGVKDRYMEQQQYSQRQSDNSLKQKKQQQESKNGSERKGEMQQSKEKGKKRGICGKINLSKCCGCNIF